MALVATLAEARGDRIALPSQDTFVHQTRREQKCAPDAQEGGAGRDRGKEEIIHVRDRA